MAQRTFSADLSKFGVTVDKRMTSLIRQTALGLLDDLQATNPVDTGWSRASWQLTLNKRGTGVWSYKGSWVPGHSWKGNKPPHGAAISIPQQKEHLRALVWTDKVFLTNNVPYVTGDSPSGQLSIEARYGFIAAAMARARVSLYAIAMRLAK
jgi:hypothetical protein